MFQLIQQDNVLENREQKLKEEVTYYVGLPGHFKDEEATYEVDILPQTQKNKELPSIIVKTQWMCLLA